MNRLDTIRRQRLEHRLLTSNYPQDLVPQVLDIPDYIEVVSTENLKKDSNKELEAKVQKTAITTNPNSIPVPLTEEQAEAADLRIKAALANIATARQGLRDVRQELDKKIKDQNNESVSFPVDVKGKPRLIRAIKRLWGEKRTEITFDMYKELLEAKQKLEKQEVDKFASGKIKR